MNNESEFYVGYLPVPARLKKFLRRVVPALGAIAAATALTLVAAQHPFAATTFEYEQYREFAGTLLEKPYPALAIPGQGLPWLLVLPGKHGAAEAVRGLEGRDIRLKGARIFRGPDHMIELLPGSLTAASSGEAARPETTDLGVVELTGEIVDSKCFFGVMNPGNGKVHRDCAVRCISGGIPPALLVRDAEGHLTTLLIANWRSELLDHVAEPISLRGKLTRTAGRLALALE